MKLFRHGPIGQERPGTVDAAGVLRDLSGITDDFAGAGLDPARLARVRDLDLSTCPPPSLRIPVSVRTWTASPTSSPSV